MVAFIDDHLPVLGDAIDEALSGLVIAGEVPPNHVVGHREEATIWTLGALDARFFADALHPLVGAGWGVAGLAGFPALESTRVHVLSSAEQRTE